MLSACLASQTHNRLLEQSVRTLLACSRACLAPTPTRIRPSTSELGWLISEGSRYHFHSPSNPATGFMPLLDCPGLTTPSLDCQGPAAHLDLTASLAAPALPSPTFRPPIPKQPLHRASPCLCWLAPAAPQPSPIKPAAHCHAGIHLAGLPCPLDICWVHQGCDHRSVEAQPWQSYLHASLHLAALLADAPHAHGALLPARQDAGAVSSAGNGCDRPMVGVVNREQELSTLGAKCADAPITPATHYGGAILQDRQESVVLGRVAG